MSSTRRFTAVVAAVLTNAMIWLIAVPVVGLELLVSQPGDRPPMLVGLPAVIATSLVAGLAGWALLGLLERRTRRAGAIWTTVAVIVLLLSFAPLLLGADTAATTRVALGSMHLTAGAILIGGLPQRSATGVGERSQIS
ncbi:hypothetical protein BH20ACT5_BH20ACT5_01860 [soil metagenome]